MQETKNINYNIKFTLTITFNKDNVGMSVIQFGIEEKNFEIQNNEINLNSLTLRQKIGQMIFSLGVNENKDLLQKMNIGGIYLWQKNNEDEFKNDIQNFQSDMEIPFFVGLDLEGCFNPFEKFILFPSFSEVKNENDAYKLGVEHGRKMREMGFNINFSPVVDKEDNIWKCRAFNNSVSSNAAYYIRGLQGQGVIATAKHYPGKTLVGKDPHKMIEFTTINKDDLEPFEWSKKNGVKAVIVSHLIVNGEVNSMNSPSVVSGNVISNLKKDYDGLILTDEVGMNGLKGVYENSEREMYIDLVNAGNDMILDFNKEPWHLYKVVSIIENAVENGEISEDRIDESAIKILKMKGFKVKQLCVRTNP